MVEKPYLFANDRPRRRADVIALAQEVEARGFPGLFSESLGDKLALSLAMLDRTKRIAVGTGIAGIYLRHPHTMATGASLIEERHRDASYWAWALHTYRFMRRWESATVSLWTTCGAMCRIYAL